MFTNLNYGLDKRAPLANHNSNVGPVEGIEYFFNFYAFLGSWPMSFGFQTHFEIAEIYVCMLRWVSFREPPSIATRLYY